MPDIAVPEAQAYDTAYAKALAHVLALDDVPPPIADEARDALAALSAEAPADPGPATTGPATTGPATTGPATTGAAVTG